MSALHHPVTRYAIMLVVALGLVAPHNYKMQAEYNAARLRFVQSASDDAAREVVKLEAAFRSIYENVRTIAQLPSVIGLDQQATNLGANDRETLQQIFNNLGAGIPGSRLYITPLGFDPGTTDPVAGQSLRAAVQFDRVIIRAENANERGTTSSAITPTLISEYRQIKEHQDWLKQHYPIDRIVEGLNIPMISSPPVARPATTSAGTHHPAEEHYSLMFSVPYYGQDGVLKGSVTAIVQGQAIRSLLPEKNYALTNKDYNYVSRTSKDGQERKSLRLVKLGLPAPTLVASSVTEIQAFDPRSKWRLWAGVPNSKFHDSPVVSSIRRYELGGYAAILLLTGLLVFMQWEGVARTEARRAIYIAAETKKAEQETRRLNLELEANMKKLSEAQQALVKHERLSALGQVTATLSHEIRNPLAAIRSSLFTIRRTAEKAKIKLDRPLDRADRSIARCDNLIGDFLEYTRTQKLNVESTDAAKFLNDVLDDQVPPVGIKVTRDLQTPGPQIVIDPERFRRVVINFLDNAAQAIRDSGVEYGAIEVSCRPFEGGTIISVKDNGPGIPDDVLKRVFEPLFTTKSFGAGLGLATVKQLVEQHGAEIKIDTEVGVGSIFSVVLPGVPAEISMDKETDDLETTA